MKISKKVFASIAAVFATIAFASTSNATPMSDSYDFDYTCATCSIKEIKFTLPSAPVISSIEPNPFGGNEGFNLNNVQTSLGIDNLTFFITDNFGGFRIKNGTSILADIYSAQLFTGPLNSPEFILGSFSTTEEYICTTVCRGNLVISAAVPEPTTVALLGLGLLGVAASRRKAAKK